MTNDDSLKYFLKYVKFDTQSDDDSLTVPSSKKQIKLAKEILQDLSNLGVKSCKIDEFGQIWAFIEGDSNLPTIGFNAHMDTATDYSGCGVIPRLIHNYNGESILKKCGSLIDVNDFPIFKKYVGQDIVVSDSDTLLGADDKAGISIIMNLVEFLISNPNFKHHPISLLFTCDEEIGRGADHFDSQKFNANYAYTIDGDSPYIASYENFNAAHIDVDIQGISIHPGEAKDKMINAIKIAMDFDALLNPQQVPEKTQGYEGFHHLTQMCGTTSHAKLSYIIRDHDKQKLEEKIKEFYNAKAIIQQKYPKLNELVIEVGYDYKNMKEIFEKDDSALLKIKNVFNKLNLKLDFVPIRGGTDGATFSFKGCPTPNLGTGSYNHHGPFEFLVKQEHDLMIEILKEIVKA